MSDEQAVETIARAIYESTSDFDADPPDTAWDDLRDETRGYYRIEARAALDALRGLGYRSRGEIKQAIYEANGLYDGGYEDDSAHDALERVLRVLVGDEHA